MHSKARHQDAELRNRPAAGWVQWLTSHGARE